ncbi:putative uridine nucleosidase 2 [Dichanthelium oligosanthes]|uniref:Putative uridine nucleosidase 2 n=1 Tax=Dichanthelium oligosanthes TaxID=888268 RepID=A0A1E5UN06_9POAL|nr:putative uridine nucleosidase 2 [Dichanthelium oligosanthes]
MKVGERRKKVIIDTDPGTDDAMAILVALRSPELQVLGLTTTFGNVHTAVATRNALHLALGLDPSFPKKIGQIVLLGGAFSVNGNVNPAAESNMFGDPDAADIIFTCGADVLAVGINITHQVLLSDADREKLEHS